MFALQNIHQARAEGIYHRVASVDTPRGDYGLLGASSSGQLPIAGCRQISKSTAGNQPLFIHSNNRAAGAIEEAWPWRM